MALLQNRLYRRLHARILYTSFSGLLLLSGWISLRVLSQETAVDGYVRITPDESLPAPSAVALFTLQNGAGQLISEAAVEAVRPSPAGRLFLDQRGSSTGLALVNPGQQPVTALLVLRDQAGNRVGEHEVSLPGGHHLASFAEEFFSLPSQFIGSLTYQAQEGELAGVTLRQSLSTHNEPILAALPLVGLPEPQAAAGLGSPRPAQDEGSPDLFFGHIGAGDAGAFSLTTEVILISRSSRPAQGHIDFFTSTGEPFPIDAPGPQESTSSIPFQLPADGVLTILVNRQGPPEQGYAVLRTEQGDTPAGTALFQFRAPSGGLISEAGVAGTPGLTRASLFADTAGTQTGLALANPNSEAVTVELTLRDRLGREVARHELVLAAAGHTSAFLDQIFDTLPAGFTGTLEVTSPLPVVVVSLKLTFNSRNDPILTTLPIADLDRPPAAGDWILPQVGFGPGITTRLLLLAIDSRSSTGTLSFRLSNGEPMSVPLVGSQVTESPYEIVPGGAIQLRMGNRALPARIQFPAAGPGAELALNQGSRLVLRPLVIDDQGELRDDFPTHFFSLDSEVASIDDGGELAALSPGFSTLGVQVGEVIEVLTLSVASLFSAASPFQIDGLVTDPSQRLLLAISQEHVLIQQDDLESQAVLYAGQQGVPGLLDGPRADSRFMEPSQLAIDGAGGEVYVADRLNHAIRVVAPGIAGRVSTAAGSGFPGSQDGFGAAASFREPSGLALDGRGQLWIADSGNHTIRRLNLSTGEVITVAGLAGVPGDNDGTGSAARFDSPRGLAFVPESLAQKLSRQSSGEAPPAVSVLVADSGNAAIRQVFEDGRVVQLTPATAISPSGNSAERPVPVTVTVDDLGNIFFADSRQSNLFTLLQDGLPAPVLEDGSLGDPRALTAPTAGQLLAADGNGLTRIIFGAPRIDSISPSQVSSRGGDEVTIEGGNFAPGTLVVVAGQTLEGVVVENTRSLHFQLPRLNSGLTLVSVQSRGGLAQSSLLIEPPSLESLPAGFVTTVAGGTTFEGEGSPALEVPMRPVGLALDNSGRLLVADSHNSRIRRIDPITGLTLTVAGTGRDGFRGDGEIATAAELDHPTGILVDGQGNTWIADAYNSLIRRVDGASGILTTIAGGDSECLEAGDGDPARSACIGLTEVAGLAFDPTPPTLFFSDSDRSTVRAIDLTAGTISTLAGGGMPEDQLGDGLPANQARLEGPVGLALQGEALFVTEYGGHRIRRVRLDTLLIDTVAGTGTSSFSGDGGPALLAELDTPIGLSFDLDGNLLFADRGNYRVRKINLSDGTIETVVGDGAFNPISEGSPPLETSLLDPVALAVDGAGNLFVADSGLLQVLRLDSRINSVNRVGGSGQLATVRDGPAFAASLNSPSGITSDGLGNLYVADGNLLIRRIDPGNNITTFAGGGDPDDELGNGGPARDAEFCSLAGLATDSQGNLFLTDVCNHQVRQILKATGIIQNVAGRWREEGFSGDNGPALDARLNNPEDVAIDADGNLLIADRFNHRVRLVEMSTGTIRTIAGNGAPGADGDGGPALDSRLSEPVGVVADSLGNVYVAQIGEQLERVRRIAPDGNISTIAGGGSEIIDGVIATESFISPDRIALGGDNFLYLLGNATVRRINLATLIIETVAGKVYEEGFAGDGGPALDARFFEARGLTFDPHRNLFIADTSNHRIRGLRGPIP